MAEESGDGKEDNWDNSGHTSEGKSVDDIGGGSSLASVSEFSDWLIAVGSIIFSDKSNDQTGPETE